LAPPPAKKLGGLRSATRSDHSSLIIHRMISGLNDFFASSLQRSRIASTTTHGIVERSRSGDFNTYQETFHLSQAIDLDPERGTARMNPIFSPIDANFDQPLSTQDPRFRGVRLFNSQGSQPVEMEYRIQCQQAPDSIRNCGYFYLYMADWGIVGQGSTCSGGLPAIVQGPVSTTDTLNPQETTVGDCMDLFLNSTVPDPVTGEPVKRFAATGLFDPVTGEISFPNLAIRLFAPDVPADPNHVDIDTTLQLALTTECVTADFVPNRDALSQRLVHQPTLSDLLFDRNLMGLGGVNPLSLYVGSHCADPRELHGRRLRLRSATGEILNEDTTETFDGVTPGPLNFDLAGVGRLRSTEPRAQDKMMYVILKVEIE